MGAIQTHTHHLFVIQNLPLLCLWDQWNLGASGPKATIKYCRELLIRCLLGRLTKAFRNRTVRPR